MWNYLFFPPSLPLLPLSPPPSLLTPQPSLLFRDRTALWSPSWSHPCSPPTPASPVTKWHILVTTHTSGDILMCYHNSSRVSFSLPYIPLSASIASLHYHSGDGEEYVHGFWVLALPNFLTKHWWQRFVCVVNILSGRSLTVCVLFSAHDQI